jgi:hypothetical protein
MRAKGTATFGSGVQQLTGHRHRERPWWNLGLQALLREERLSLGFAWGRQPSIGHTQLAAGIKLSF